MASTDTLLPAPHPRRSMFQTPWPREVVAAWAVAGAAFAAVFGAWCWRYYVLGRRGPGSGTNGGRRSARLKAQ